MNRQRLTILNTTDKEEEDITMNHIDRKHTLLVVDDDIDILEQTRIFLETAGYNVVTAEKQKDAEEILETFKPDLAILDLMMENQDSGFILSYKIKKKDPTIPIIIVTAVTSRTGISFGVTDQQERSWIKADVIMEKDIRYENLLGEVERLLANRPKTNGAG
jgi:two-component system, OmpR family, response regulator